MPEPVKDSQGQIAKTVDQIKGHKDIENFNMFKESVKRVNKGVKNIISQNKVKEFMWKCNKACFINKILIIIMFKNYIKIFY